MKFTEEKFVFLKPIVRDFKEFMGELRPLLESWSPLANDTFMDKSWKTRTSEAKRLENALGKLSPQTRGFFKTFAGISADDLSKLQKACALAQDPPRKINGLPVPGRKPKQGRQKNVEADVMIDRLHILLCQHTKNPFPPEKNTALFKRFAKTAFARTNLAAGEDAVRKRIEPRPKRTKTSQK
jgi:hypothetical protein